MTNIRLAAVSLLLIALPGAALAEQTVKKSNTTRATATIQAIDHTTRAVTLRLKDGSDETFTAGPEIQRFNELKVGDTVEMSYVESLVVQVHKPGAENVPSGTSADGKVTRGQGSSPSATLSQQAKTTVTVKAVNPATPSITVLTADGRTVTHRIEDKKNLEGVKAGDKLEITYTEALLVSIAPGKK